MMTKEEKNYWRYKELYLRLPPMMQYQIARDTRPFKVAVKMFLIRLPKLEQLIYTNEIQGE